MSNPLKSDYKPFSIKDDKISLNNDSNEETKESFWKWICHELDELFVKYIPFPDLRDYPPRIMYPSGTVLIILIVLFWAALFGYLFNSEKNNTFLAPRDDSSGASGATCNDVLVPNTGKYLATREGKWEGASGFDYSVSAYSLTASSWKMDTAYYANAMKLLKEYLESVGETTSQSDLGINLLYWFSFIGLADPNNFANRFTLTGDPSVALNRQNIFGTVSSIHGVCQLPSQVSSYDKANGVLRLTLPYSEYINSPNCMSAGDPKYLGYDQYINADNLQITIDVYSLATAVAVNLNILLFNGLIEITALRKPLTFSDGSTVMTSSYHNPKFPGMTPIVCIIGVYCFLPLGDSNYAIPFFHHMGNDSYFPQRCDCSKMSDTNKQDAYHFCNRFLFLTGFYFFSSDNLLPLEQFIKIHPYTSHSASYYSAFTSSAFGLSSPYYYYFQDPATLDVLYDFCRTPAGNCTMVTFSIYDVSNPGWSISDHYFQLLNGACQDQVTSSDEAWQALVDTPFSPLTAEYQQCKNSETYVFFLQLGAALGSIDLVILLSIVITLLLIAIYQKVTGDKIPVTTYSREERDSALSALAVSLLLARDRRRSKKQKMLSLHSSCHSQDYSYFFENNDIGNNVEEDIIEKFVNALDEDSSYHSDAAQLNRKVSELFKKKGKSFYMKLSEEVTLDDINVNDTAEDIGDDVEKQVGEEKQLEMTPVVEINHINIINLFDSVVTVLEDDASWQNPFRDADLPALVDGLIFFLTNAFRTKLTRETNNNPFPSNFPLYSVDSEYAKGCILSKQLREMNEDELLRQSDQIIFVTLANALSIQASLSLNLELRDISRLYGDRVGYQIGNKLFTYSVLTAYSLRNPTTLAL